MMPVGITTTTTTTTEQKNGQGREPLAEFIMKAYHHENEYTHTAGAASA
jgi:hypothetical protein